MLEKLQMYINGEWVDSHSTETIEVMNPSDDSVLGVITAGNSDDVDKAVAAAKAAFVDFSFSSFGCFKPPTWSRQAQPLKKDAFQT